jgi:hypothetical protein
LLRGFADHLLALFTSREVAESIVGDLLERRHAHRRGWFAFEVARLALTLCCNDVVAAPWRACRQAALGWAVYICSSVIVFIASGLPRYPWHRVDEPVFWIRLWLVFFVANFVTGAILARRRSSSASAIAPLIILWLVGWLVLPFWITFVGERLQWPWADVPGIVSSAALVPLCYLIPLVLGACVGQSRHRIAATQAD